MTESAKPEPEAGVHLVISLTRESLTVLRAARITDARRMLLREPLLTPASWQGYSQPVSELALAIFNKNGDLLDSFGWAAASQSFFDTVGPGEYGDVVGELGSSRAGKRVLRVPLRPGATFLLFYLSEVQFASPARFAQRPLALYAIGKPPWPPFPPIPPRPLPIPQEPIPPPLPLPWLRRAVQRVTRPIRDPRIYQYWIDSGYILDVKTLVDNGDPAHHFDIVIVGDGFKLSELPLFDTRAQLIANGLLAMPPFNSIAASINVHTVRTVSIDSGVDDCPNAGDLHSTYYNVKGDFHGTGYAGFFGTPTPEKVWTAAERVTPLENVDLCIVLANVAFDGASAFPDLEMAFTSQWNTDVLTVNMTAHECCHAIARTCEEYISCNPNDPLVTYSNQATEAQRRTETVWWKSLATPAELQLAGGFKAVHGLGDPFDASGRDPLMPAGLQGMMGLYWGCQDIDPTKVSTVLCDVYQDARGAGFYRSMAKCRMRRSVDPFCRVCSQVMTDVILAATP